MTTRPFASAAGAILFGLCVAVASAGAQTSTDSMSKQDAMKSDTMEKDRMKTDSMKMGSKADCMHKAGLEKDSMKKSEGIAPSLRNFSDSVPVQDEDHPHEVNSWKR